MVGVASPANVPSRMASARKTAVHGADSVSGSTAIVSRPARQLAYAIDCHRWSKRRHAGCLAS
jgi:hypothetical protein